MSDPALARVLSIGGGENYSGVPIGEGSALTVSAVYRAVALISETLASLPMQTVRTLNGVRQVIPSWLDNPGTNEGPTPFEFWETVYCHLLLHGNGFLVHAYNGAGLIAGLIPVHPLAVNVEWEVRDGKHTGRKVYTVMLTDGRQRTYNQTELTHVSGKSLDGLRGLSVISLAANSMGTALAGDRAAAKMFSSGGLVSGYMVPSSAGDGLEPDEAKAAQNQINREFTGWENASRIPVFNQYMEFHKWSMSSVDAQFLESRSFQVEEIARWFGVPPHALMQTEKQTSWGTGIESQQRGLARTVLAPWATRVEHRMSRLLPRPQVAAVDFSGLERATPTEEAATLSTLVVGGILTPNEARARLNLAPVEGGEVLRATGPAAPTDPADPAAPADPDPEVIT